MSPFDTMIIAYVKAMPKLLRVTKSANKHPACHSLLACCQGGGREINSSVDRCIELDETSVRTKHSDFGLLLNLRARHMIFEVER